MTEEIKKKMLMVSAILYKSNVPIEEAKIIGHFIEQLQQENQQLKERINMSININRKNKELLSVLDEIREVINQNMSSYSSCIKAFDEIEEILDKVKDL